MADYVIDTPQEVIAELYVAYWDRAPDPDGLQYWVNLYQGGMSFADIAENFAMNQEAQDQYPYLKYPDVVSPDTFITSIYQNLFDRAPDADGLAYWKDMLLGTNDSGHNPDGTVVSPGHMIATILYSAQNGGAASAEDWVTVVNKVQVGVYYAEQFAQSGDTWDAANDMAGAHAVLDGVTHDPATVPQGFQTVDDVIDHLNHDGQTFVLTYETDDIHGTDGDDLIVASVSDQPIWTTLNPSDIIDGGSGEDTLRVTTQDPIGPPPSVATQGFEMHNVENLEIQAYLNLQLGLSNVDGLKKVISHNSTKDIKLDDVQNLVDLDLKGETDIKVNYASAVTAQTQTQNILLDDYDGEISIEDIQNVSITTHGENSEVKISNDYYFENVTLTGDKDLDLILDDPVDIVDASGLDAKLDLHAEDASQVTATSHDDHLYLTEEGGAAQIDSGAGNDYINIHANAYSDIDLNVTTGDGNDEASVHVDKDPNNNSTYHSVNVTADMGSGNDSLYILDDDPSSLQVNLGDGNDAIKLLNTSGLKSAYIIDGGQGNDTIYVNAIDDVNDQNAFEHTSNIETLTVDNSSSGYSGTFDGTATKANDAGIFNYQFIGFPAGDVDLENVASGQVNISFDLDEDVLQQNHAITIKQEDTSQDKANVTFNLYDQPTYSSSYVLSTVNVDNTEIFDLNLYDAILGDQQNQDTSDTIGINQLVSTQLQSFVIHGDVALDISDGATGGAGINAANLTNIDATNLTHDLKLDLDDVANNVTVNGGSADDTIYLNDSNSTMTAHGGDGNDHLFGNANNDTLYGDGGNDTLMPGAGIDNVQGGTGDDTIIFKTGELTSADTVDGGDGTDTVIIQDDSTTSITGSDDFFYKWTSVEVLDLATTGNDDLSFGAIANDSGLNTIVLSGGGDDHLTFGDAFVNPIKVEMKAAGDVNIDASTSSCSLTVEGEAHYFTNSDQLKGGTGNGDVIHIIADNQTANLGTHVNGFETINITAPDQSTDVSLTVDNAVVAAGATVTVDASTFGATSTDSNDLTFDGSAELDGNFIIDSGSGNDTITTGEGDDTINAGAGDDIINANKGDDTINAGAGDDTITGGEGSDTITGGDGADTFLYSGNDSHGPTLDTITDFVSGTDQLSIDTTSNNGNYIGEANGYGAVLSSLTGTVGDAVLDTSTSTLYVDMNGDAQIDDNDLVIALTGVTDLDSGDFIFN